MPVKFGVTQNWTLASAPLLDAYTDSMLSRQAAQCSIATLRIYSFTAGKFLTWIEGQGVTAPAEVTARHVRMYLAMLRERGLSDRTAHTHARAIKTLLVFWAREKYMPERVYFDMPRLAKKCLPVLSPDELCALDWDDIDFSNGLLRVKRGKGGKARSAVIGVKARPALLAYRRTIEPTGPMFQSEKGGGRLSREGPRLLCRRLRIKTGVHVTPHALRRTFTILSLRSGMDVLHLQALGGWAGLKMVSHYAQMVDDDLLHAHKAHSPIDNLSRLH